MDSILTSIKKMLGITEEYECFDADIIMDINAVFVILNQLGVGPASYFSISDKETTWDEFLTDTTVVGLAKPYMYLKVQLMFDHTLSSSVVDSINKQINEFEWRLNVAVDPGEEDSES